MKTSDKRTIRNISIFSLIALSCGWIGRLVDLKAGMDDNGSLGMLIWIVSPLLAMVIMRVFMGDGWKDMGIKLRFKSNMFLYFVSILFFPIATLIIVGFGYSLKMIEVVTTSPLLFAAISAALISNFIKNIFEEFAWRGYLAPRLFSLGFNRLLIHIYVGVIWAAWHFPYLFVFMDTTESMLTFIPRIMIGLVILSIVYGEIRLMTNSVWPAVIMHTVGNVIVNTLILDKYLNIREGFDYLVMPSPEGVFSILIAAMAGLWLYRKRMKKHVDPSANYSV